MSIPVGSAAESVRANPVLAGRFGAVEGVAVIGAKPEATDHQVDVSPDALDRAVADINESLVNHVVGVRFEIDSETDQVVVKVVDRTSGELIRQMPSEEVLRIAKLMGKFAGVLMTQAA